MGQHKWSEVIRLVKLTVRYVQLHNGVWVQSDKVMIKIRLLLLIKLLLKHIFKKIFKQVGLICPCINKQIKN